MTCIVGMTDGKTVWMGADSAMTINGDGDVVSLKGSKIFRIGKILIGGSGDAAISNLDFHADEIPQPENGEDARLYMGKRLLPALIEIGGKLNLIRESEGHMAGFGNWIVGLQGRLFEIDNHLAVAETNSPFSAVGIGAPYAMGYLEAATGALRKDFEVIVIDALRVACKYSPACRPPFTNLRLGPFKKAVVP